MPARYNNQITILNGVILKDSNIGQKVEMDVVLRDFHTGQIHRHYKAFGTYVGNAVVSVENEPWLYASFENMTLDDGSGLPRFIGPGGWPFAQFANAWS